MKRKKADDSLQIGLIVSFDHDELGLPRLKVQTEPHDSPEERAQGLALAKDFASTQKCPNAAEEPLKVQLAGKSLQAAVDEFLNESQIKSATLRAYRGALTNHALPFFKPDTNIGDIDQERFAAYVRHVFAKEAGAHATKKSYVLAFTSLFSWLRARYPKQAAQLSAEKLIPINSVRADEQRDGFTMEELGTLFENARKYLEAEPHKFWVTVAAAFTGCRIEELAQVNLETDLHQNKEGVWYFEFNEKADGDGVKRKSIKRASSKRVAPIHSALVRHGFLAFLEAQRALGMTRPFEAAWKPGIEATKGGYKWAKSIIKWGGRELDKLDEAGTLKRESGTLTYFHSMRHTFAHTLAVRDVSEEKRAALQGQTVAGAGENAARYTKLKQDVNALSSLVELNLTDYSALLDGLLSAKCGAV